MKMQSMIDAVCDEIKQNLNDFCNQADLDHLTPEVAEQMSRAFSRALDAGGVAGIALFSASMKPMRRRLLMRTRRCVLRWFRKRHS